MSGDEQGATREPREAAVEKVIDADEAGQRLDRYLRKRLTGTPLSALHRMLRTGKVRVNGAKAEGDARLAEGDRVSVQMPRETFEHDARQKVRAKAVSEDVARVAAQRLQVLYRDDDVLVINKPSGLLMHPGAGHEHEPTLIDLILAAYDRGDGESTFRPSLVHRLDRETSGAVAVALSGPALRKLAEMFRRHDATNGVTKQYCAIIWGTPRPAKGTIIAPVVREDAPHAGARKVKVAAAGGQYAETRYETVTTGKGAALVRLVIRTGRTHQIRAHLLSRGLPIVGDPRYGIEHLPPTFAPSPAMRVVLSQAKRQLLHAAMLRFPHPTKAGVWVEVKAGLPDDMVAMAKALKLDLTHL